MKRPVVLIDKFATSVGCFLALGGLLNEAVLFTVDPLAAANLAHEAAAAASKRNNRTLKRTLLWLEGRMKTME